MTALGPVAHADLPTLVATADAFVLPSTAASSGRAGLEAVAAGVPTVVADLPMRREVFGDAVRYGADAEGTADAIADALERPGGDRGRRGRALAASRTWDATAEAHQALYATLATA
jgi:glycosyltransferase involved in cell wall biosynthesis